RPHHLPAGAAALPHGPRRAVHVPPPVGHPAPAGRAVPGRRLPVPVTRPRRPAHLDRPRPPHQRHRPGGLVRVRHQPHPPHRRLARDARRTHRLSPETSRVLQPQPSPRPAHTPTPLLTATSCRGSSTTPAAS